MWLFRHLFDVSLVNPRLVNAILCLETNMTFWNSKRLSQCRFWTRAWLGGAQVQVICLFRSGFWPSQSQKKLGWVECQGIDCQNPKRKTHRVAASRPVNVKHISSVKKGAELLFALNALNVFTNLCNGQRPHIRTHWKLTVFNFFLSFLNKYLKSSLFFGLEKVSSIVVLRDFEIRPRKG